MTAIKIDRIERELRHLRLLFEEPAMPQDEAVQTARHERALSAMGDGVILLLALHSGLRDHLDSGTASIEPPAGSAAWRMIDAIGMAGDAMRETLRECEDMLARVQMQDCDTSLALLLRRE